MFLRNSLQQLIEGLFPSYCVGCGRIGVVCCTECVAAQLDIRFDLVSDELVRQWYIHSVTTAGLYLNSLWGTAIHEFKYSQVRAYAPVFSAALGHALAEHLLPTLTASPILVPIPMSKTKRRQRGYNHTELIAQTLCKQFEIPVAHALQITHTAEQSAPQAALNKTERFRTAQQRYTVNAEAQSTLRGRAVIIIDDVISTGATVQAAAAQIQQCAPAQIHVLAVARNA